MEIDINKKFIFYFLLFSLFFLAGCAPQKEVNLIEEKPGPTKGGETMGKVLMVIAPENFRDEEYQKPKSILENAGYRVMTASKGVRLAKGMLGATANVDLDLSQVNLADFTAVIFVGGSGASVYFNDQTVLNLASQAVSQGKVVGAICIAPSILANAGLLNGKEATAFSSEAENLKGKGALYSGQPVTVDGEIITANGPAAAEEFGQTILEILRGG
jgi:protease I